MIGYDFPRNCRKREIDTAISSGTCVFLTSAHWQKVVFGPGGVLCEFLYRSCDTPGAALPLFFS